MIHSKIQTSICLFNNFLQYKIKTEFIQLERFSGRSVDHAARGDCVDRSLGD